MDHSNYSEQNAIEDARHGIERGYIYLLDTYKAFAFSVAIQITDNEQDAEEIVQDSFVKAFKSITKFKNLGKFSTWLYRIVYNTSLTTKKRRKINYQYINDTSDYIFDIPDNYKNGFQLLSDKDINDYLRIAINKLSEAEKVTSTLYYLNQCSIREIETITNMNKSTIKSCLFRSRQKLYHELSIILDSEIKDIYYETKLG